VKRRNLYIGCGVAAIVIAIVVAFGSFSITPHYIEDDKANTAAAIDQFHSRLNEGDFEGIYRDAHPALQQSGSKQDLITAMQQTRERFGRVTAKTSSALNEIMGAPAQVRAVYTVTCEKGEATEWFTFVMDGLVPRLAQYQIFPGAVRPSSQ
jgi:hypothetical protein